MKRIFDLTLALTAVALVGSLSACTISTGDDDDDDPSGESDGGADDDADDDDADDDTTDDDPDDDTPADDDDSDAGADDDADDDSDGDADAGADDEPEPEGDAGMDPEPEGDAAAPDPDPEPDPDPPSDVTLIDCGDRDATDATVVDSSLTEDTTWSGLIYLDARVDVGDGITLTIEPGTRIIAAVDTDLQLGFAGGATTVDAQGTADEPITFCGEQDDAGFWLGVQVDANVTSNSVMSNVLIADAGGGGTALTLSADITVENVQVRNSGGDGVAATDFEDDSTQLSVTGANGAAVVLDGSGAATRFPLGGIFEDNEDNVALVDFSSVIDDTVFPDIGIPYRQTGNLDVQDVEISFEPGVEYEVSADRDLQFGFAGSAPTVTIEGTEDEPIIFRGVTAEPGFWDGISIDPNVVSASSMAHVQIMDGGGNGPALSLNAPISVNDVSLEDNAEGVFIDAVGLDEDSSNLSVTGTQGFPLNVEPNALTTIPRGGDLSGNDNDQILVEGGPYGVSGNIADLGIPYRIDANIDVGDGASMTIEPGVEFVMSADTDIQFGFAGGEVTIVAEGTEEDPIRFTGSDETPGSWSGLLVDANVLSNSSFNWVEIGHAGGNGAALTLRRALPVTNCTFFDSSGFGIVKQADDTTDYAADNTFTNNASGDVGDN